MVVFLRCQKFMAKVDVIFLQFSSTVDKELNFIMEFQQPRQSRIVRGTQSWELPVCSFKRIAEKCDLPSITVYDAALRVFVGVADAIEVTVASAIQDYLES
jgi:hypothetical protein